MNKRDLKKKVEEREYVFRVILPQTMSGLCVSGLFYGWGALAMAIDEALSPDNPRSFENLHGSFAGVTILVLSVIPMIPIRMIIDSKYLTDYQVQGIGLIVTLLGLVIGNLNFNPLNSTPGTNVSKLYPNLSQLNPNLSQLNPNMSQLNPNLSQLNSKTFLSREEVL